MKTLVVDTETTGRANFRGELMDQPFMVQLGAILYDDRRVVHECNFITRPSMRGSREEVQAEAANIHGISTDWAHELGMDYKVAIGVLNNMVKRADRIVAHNFQFDDLIIRATYSRIAANQDDYLRPNKICTMLSSTKPCNIRGPRGAKWPKLEEAYRILVNEAGFEGAHDAMVDVRACAAVLFALEDAGHKVRYKK